MSRNTYLYGCQKIKCIERSYGIHLHPQLKVKFIQKLIWQESSTKAQLEQQGRAQRVEEKIRGRQCEGGVIGAQRIMKSWHNEKKDKKNEENVKSQQVRK